MSEEKKVGGMPENAFKELVPGEEYKPLVGDDGDPKEWTGRAVGLGLIMVVFFTAASAFLGFKVGQVFECAIPIAILAVGIGNRFRNRFTITENVVVQSIGAASGLIVAGAIFTIPAFFILGLPVDLLKIFLVSALGGVLGICFFIPYRKYFIKEMHGKFNFPEAKATTKILVAGETGGKEAKFMMIAAVIGGVFDTVIMHLQGFAEVFSSRAIPVLTGLADKTKMVFKIDVMASLLGMGYLIGLDAAGVICVGSFVSWFVLVPLIGYFGSDMTGVVRDAPTLIKDMPPELIFRNYVRLIGIGGIACAALIGIIKNRRVVFGSFGLMFKAGRANSTMAVGRTDRNLSSRLLTGILLAVAVGLFLFFLFGVLAGHEGQLKLAFMSLIMVIVLIFMFTTVSAQATASMGNNPVSGMTLMTLIVSSIILYQLGLRESFGMMAALLIGGVACTSLAVTGGFLTDLKIGHWIGSTPAIQQRSKLLGSLVAALIVGGVMVLLNRVYGFVATDATPNPLPAPQANAMAAVVSTLMSNNPVPWILYGTGAIFVLLMSYAKVHPLLFAIGLYIPLELNVPMLVGALIAYFVSKSAKDDKDLAEARNTRGESVATGLVAGGAVMGVLAAIFRWLEQDMGMKLGVGLFNNGEGSFAELFGLGMYIALIGYLFISARIVKKSNA